jgi:hypothetical protein
VLALEVSKVVAPLGPQVYSILTGQMRTRSCNITILEFRVAALTATPLHVSLVRRIGSKDACKASDESKRPDIVSDHDASSLSEALRVRNCRQQC